MFGLFKVKKESISAVSLAEVTYTYIERSNDLIYRFLEENHQEVTEERMKEVTAFSLNIYRLGFVKSKFAPKEKTLLVQKLLAITYMQFVIDNDLEIELDFLVGRCKLYDQAMVEAKNNNTGAILLAQFAACCDLEANSILADFNDFSDVIFRGLILTAVKRNDDLAKKSYIVDE